MKFTRIKGIRGEITVPGDKSISHRAVMFGSLAQGITTVENFLRGADCLSTIDCFRRLGISIEETPEQITIHGKGLDGLSVPSEILDAGNSGTTTRLISGILSGQTFETTLTGDASIQKRPMGRIIEPLTQMGASITSLGGNGCAPLRIEGRPLHGIHYTTKVASAQVKSAILLAGLYADSPTSVTEPALSRNHSELMLSLFGANIKTEGTTATIEPRPRLSGQKILVPGDISSAARALRRSAGPQFLSEGLCYRRGTDSYPHRRTAHHRRYGLLRRRHDCNSGRRGTQSQGIKPDRRHGGKPCSHGSERHGH